MAASGSGGRRGRGRGRRRQMSEPNVTPLVDVMLVLLIVFMVAAPLLTAGVAVDLPQTSSSPLPGQDEPLSVTVGKEGKVYLQESEIAVDQLGPRLQAVTQRNREARIFVRGDQAVNYGQVMAVMGAIHSAGFTKVALLTQTPDEAAAAALSGSGT